MVQIPDNIPIILFTLLYSKLEHVNTSTPYELHSVLVSNSIFSTSLTLNSGLEKYFTNLALNSILKCKLIIKQTVYT